MGEVRSGAGKDRGWWLKVVKRGTHYTNYTIDIVDLVTLVDPESGTIHL